MSRSRLARTMLFALLGLVIGGVGLYGPLLVGSASVRAGDGEGLIGTIHPEDHKEHDAMNASTDSGEQARRLSSSGYDLTPPSEEEKQALLADLTDEQIRITQRSGTEPAFCGGLLENKEEGVYTCVVCDLPLFNSQTKFESGSGWPSFHTPFDKDHIAYYEDNAYGMKRVDIRCARCDAHLGHVFEDGPPPTGLRYCLNSSALQFFSADEQLPEGSQPVQTETAYFAGGCFWGVEDRFQQLPGVIDAVSGYQGGHVDNPTYKEVCYEDTGHAESVRVTYDPSRISYRDLLEFFFKIHNPTTKNRQGPDVGPQYRSAIFAVDERQRRAAKEYIEQLEAEGAWKGRPIVTQVNDDAEFYEAEEYHQDYHLKHGGHCPMPAMD